MRQVLQNIRNGDLTVATLPAPLVRPGEVLIANSHSVISAGTEKMVLELSKKSLLDKARERPDHVRRVLEKIRNEGLVNTIQQVREKLDSPITMGYSSAGVVLACGHDVEEFKAGDRVASNGPHAEIVSVPKHLCARVPDGVPTEQAAFGILGAIALHGVRLSKVTLGETAFVIGLGLIGQLAVGFLKAAGCRVIGTDLDPSKCELAVQMGADLARPGLSAHDVETKTNGLGADIVLITASTSSNQPIELASAAVRQKGRIVLVGVVGLELDRRAFYFKEAEFLVSCSYGPGRYEPSYEELGHDYPAAYVRWTEQRNLQSVLDVMSMGKLDVTPLITHRFQIENAGDAYALIETNSQPHTAIVLSYPDSQRQAGNSKLELRATRKGTGRLGLGVLGAGNFARMVLLPAIKESQQFESLLLCSAGGVSAEHAGKKHDFQAVTTDENDVFTNSDVDVTFSITQHDQHARHVLKAIEHQKHLFIEKPLCLNLRELADIEEAIQTAGESMPLVMVGFNRRFSPAAKQVKEFFANVQEPLTISIRFNAGAILADHWTQQAETGGGRIIGEACHGIDLATFLTGAVPIRVFAESIGGASAPEICDDQSFITLRHENGSISNIAYLSGGDKAFPKERIEVFGGGQVAVIDDFRQITLVRNGKTDVIKLKGQDKGHRGEVVAFANAIQQGLAAPISWHETYSVSAASILAVQSLREGLPLDVC